MFVKNNMDSRAKVASIAVTSGLLPIYCVGSKDIMFSNGKDAIFISAKEPTKNEKIVSAVSLCNAIGASEKDIDKIVTMLNHGEENLAYEILDSKVIDFALAGTDERCDIFAKHINRVATDEYYASMFKSVGISPEDVNALTAGLKENASQISNSKNIEFER